VFAAKFAPARAFFNVAVFDEVGGLFGSAGARFKAHQRFGADFLHQARNSLVPNWLEFSEFQALSRTMGRSFFEPTRPAIVSRYEVATWVANDRTPGV